MDTKQFCRREKITAVAEMVDENPGNPDWRDAHHYKVVLKRARKQLTTYFSMGLAHCREPEAAEVLDCLASDSAGVEGQSFESWAEDYGYDPDSRKAEKTYRICKAQSEKLYKFLGQELYNQLLYKTERL